jgi:hypothetical protein
MEGFDLSGAIAAENGNNSEATTTETSESEIPFEANEGTEGYALFGNWAAIADDVSVEIFGNRRVYEVFDLKWEYNLSDYQSIVEEANDPTKQEKLVLLGTLAKSTFGDIQRDENSGYSLGWDTDKSPPKVYDNDKVDHVPYLDVFSDLPAFDHETLSQGEIDQLENPDLEEAEDLDMDDYGFDRSVEGPQLPVIDGERFPLFVENGDEVTKALQMLNSIDFEEVTTCEKHGELQGTPSLGPSESDSDKVAEEEDDEVNLASNPEAITEVNVNDIEVSEISSLRTIQTMLRVERENKDRSSAIDKLEGRRNTLQDSEEEEASEEEVNEAVEETEVLEEIQKTYDFGEMAMDAVKHRVEADKAENYQEAAKQVSEA